MEPEEADPAEQLFELELSDFCDWADLANKADLLGATAFCFTSLGFGFACWFLAYFIELLVGFTVLTFAGIPLSLSLLFSGLNILFFFNFFCTGSEVVFADLSGPLPFAFVEVGLFGLIATGLGFGAFFCWPAAAIALVGGLCCLTTGATVAVALGLAGGFLLAGVFTLLGNSSDSEEHATDLPFGGALLLFSAGGTGPVSDLDFPCLLGGNVGFFFILSLSDTF